jgi:hypothetical protein
MADWRRLSAAPVSFTLRHCKPEESLFVFTAFSSRTERLIMASTEQRMPFPTRNSQAITELDVLWITAGLGCDGDTIAMTAATQPSIEDVVLGADSLDSKGNPFTIPFSPLS